MIKTINNYEVKQVCGGSFKKGDFVKIRKNAKCMYSNGTIATVHKWLWADSITCKIKQTSSKSLSKLREGQLLIDECYDSANNQTTKDIATWIFQDNVTLVNNEQL